jgi:hypothetical protein
MDKAKGDRMSQKSDFLLKETEELISKAKTWGVDLVICGGLAIHMLSDFLKRNSPRAWNHKDIDLLVPLSQLSTVIVFFKDLGFVRVFVPYKKTRLTKNHMRFGTTVRGHKVLVDIYGIARIPIVRKIPNIISSSSSVFGIGSSL